MGQKKIHDGRSNAIDGPEVPVEIKPCCHLLVEINGSPERRCVAGKPQINSTKSEMNDGVTKFMEAILLHN